jgi:ubiquinone/menaquinone biosynthesis C-methylase UbiE
MRRTAFQLTACAVLLAAGLRADEPKPRYEVKKDHDPNGTGKFYMGREIAQVMHYRAASWLERKEREKEEEPAKLIKALELKEGLVVADLGAGSGYHSFRMAPLVGPTGKVLAVDIQPQMLKLIEARAKKEDVKNVEPILCTETDPKLPAGGVDLILMVDVYHELSHPYEVGEKLVAALKPGGRLVFVEYRLEDDAVPIKLVHKMSERQVLQEMGAFPELAHSKTVETLPWQHIIVFTKKGKK